MRKPALEQRLRMAVNGLPSELKQIFSQGLEAQPSASPRDQLRLITPSRSTTRPRAHLAAQTFEDLQQLEAIAPTDARDFGREIGDRLAVVRRAQAARVAWSRGKKPWPWPLLSSLRKARSATAAGRMLMAVLEVPETDLRDLVRVARAIRSADEGTARIVLAAVLGPSYTLALSHARFEA